MEVEVGVIVNMTHPAGRWWKEWKIIDGLYLFSEKARNSEKIQNEIF